MAAIFYRGLGTAGNRRGSGVRQYDILVPIASAISHLALEPMP
jgi:hypothetical protein